MHSPHYPVPVFRRRRQILQYGPCFSVNIREEREKGEGVPQEGGEHHERNEKEIELENTETRGLGKGERGRNWQV